MLFPECNQKVDHLRRFELSVATKSKWRKGLASSTVKQSSARLLTPKSVFYYRYLSVLVFIVNISRPRVNSVAPELNVEVSEDISAASITAISKPRRPGGKILKTKVG